MLGVLISSLKGRLVVIGQNERCPFLRADNLSVDALGKESEENGWPVRIAIDGQCARVFPGNLIELFEDERREVIEYWIGYNEYGEPIWRRKNELGIDQDTLATLGARFFSQADREAVTPPIPISVDTLTQLITSRSGESNVVFFWAAWCEPCVLQLSDYARLHNEPNGVRVIFVSTDYQAEDTALALLSAGVVWKTYIVMGFDLKSIEQIERDWSGAMPATFLFDRKGHLRDWWEGYADYDEIQRRANAP